MEYRTDGDKAVEHEEWPISSFGMSVSQWVSEWVTMIIARDASASENDHRWSLYEYKHRHDSNLNHNKTSLSTYRCPTSVAHQIWLSSPYCCKSAAWFEDSSKRFASCDLIFNEHSILKVLDQLPAKQRCMVVLDPAGVTSGSREMKEKKKEAEKEGLKVSSWSKMLPQQLFSIWMAQFIPRAITLFNSCKTINQIT